MNDPIVFDTNKSYVVTNFIKDITKRVILYMNNGFPVHLRGPAGTGKTSLAFHIAQKIGRPIIYICGSEEINDENLIGGYTGVRKYFVEDNFINSVYKKQEAINKTWNDGRLLTACKEGYTVIYDEFTRTRPEMNNVLLSILEEKMVDVPYANSNTYLKINPDFRIIFTSNPEEYIGAYKSPNALIDRMITIDMDNLDEDTEMKIIMSKSGIGLNDASKIMHLSRYIKNKLNNTSYASIRSSIMLAKVINSVKIKVSASNPIFKQICKDIYNPISITLNLKDENKLALNSVIDEAINFICAN